MEEKTEFNPDQEAEAASTPGEKLLYKSPELRAYGDVYERTNTSLPFTFLENYVLNKTT
jgi:hypothetical protein